MHFIHLMHHSKQWRYDMIFTESILALFALIILVAGGRA